MIGGQRNVLDWVPFYANVDIALQSFLHWDLVGARRHADPTELKESKDLPHLVYPVSCRFAVPPRVAQR